MKKRIFIFLPDGVGLRNFAFSNFYAAGENKKNDIVYWNNTVFPLEEEYGFDEVKINFSKSNYLSDVYKRARKEIELKQNFKRTKNLAYLSYSFPKSYKSLKQALKSILVNLIVYLFNSEQGLQKVRTIINKLERKTEYYSKSKERLIIERPDFILCTNQRPLLAVAPLLAAKDLKIPTATFIFSWDNLPKGMMVVETDYYFVWSKHMKNELLEYYPYILESQIKIVGTPQFESHFDKSLLQSRAAFCEKYDLDVSKQYLCFSGDDETTSPNDPYYLEDIAQSVEDLNVNENYNLGIIFRKCPVDSSNRYNKVLEKYKHIINPINPLWKPMGEHWNTVMPTPQDTKLLVNTIAHCEAVINLGSTMVFDAVVHDKPCAYINYQSEKKNCTTWHIDKIYKYVHFQSMPNKDVVVWLNSKQELKGGIKQLLNNAPKYIENAEKWMGFICERPYEEASKNIWGAIHEIITK